MKPNRQQMSSADAVSTSAPGTRIDQWVVFRLDAGRYALPLAAVDRIVRAVQVTELPQAPSVVLGAIDIGGDVLPVFDLRRRFGLPRRAIDPDDQFVIARTATRAVALAIDAASGVIGQPESAVIDSASLAPQLAQIRGVIPLEDGLVLIQDLERFLSIDEAEALDHAIDQARQSDAR
ncbi:MAG TPA: chemotaxis protein CheW [Steroidobacteraceae bacterium]|jgi:purine-binding chemotaxis protein CheW